MMRFVHCSDVHITADYFAQPLLRLGWRRWVALVELTVGGRARQYRRLRCEARMRCTWSSG